MNWDIWRIIISDFRCVYPHVYTRFSSFTPPYLDIWFCIFLLSFLGVRKLHAKFHVLDENWPTNNFQKLSILWLLFSHMSVREKEVVKVEEMKVKKKRFLFTLWHRVTLIVGLPPRLTSFWIISSQISSKAGTIKATLLWYKAV